MRRARQLWKGSGGSEFQALLVSGWSYREKFWKIGGAMNILGARVRRVFPPSWPVFLDGRPGRLLDWSICSASLLLVPSHAVFLVILFIRFNRQSSHDLEDVGGIRAKFEDSRFFYILYSFLYMYPTLEWNPRKHFFQTEFSGQTSRNLHSWRGNQRRQHRGSKAG